MLVKDCSGGASIGRFSGEVKDILGDRGARSFGVTIALLVDLCRVAADLRIAFCIRG